LSWIPSCLDKTETSDHLTNSACTTQCTVQHGALYNTAPCTTQCIFWGGMSVFGVDEQSVHFPVRVGCSVTVDLVYMGLKCSVLYMWVELSLGQGVHGWLIITPKLSTFVL
jgi:hypothetical protein